MLLCTDDKINTIKESCEKSLFLKFCFQTHIHTHTCSQSLDLRLTRNEHIYFTFIFPQYSFIFFLSSVLRVGNLPTWEDPGYATAHPLYTPLHELNK